MKKQYIWIFDVYSLCVYSLYIQDYAWNVRILVISRWQIMNSKIVIASNLRSCLRGNKMRHSNSLLHSSSHCFLCFFFCRSTEKPISLSQIPLIYADKQQNLNSNTNYLSLLNNAASCIPLRYLSYLQRE